MDFPLEQMFGEDFAEAIIWERISIVEKIAKSLTRRVKALKKGEALLYIVDSWDGVKSAEEAANFDAAALAKEGTKEKSDGYGVSKQQYTHKFFRNITDAIYGSDYATEYDYKLNQKDVTILITSQIRKKINATPFEKDTYRTGGKAFDFWTHACLWLYSAGRLVHDRKGKKITYGVKVRSVCERNKVTAPWKEARFPIVHSDNHGIDNVGSMVDYTFGPQLKKYKFKGKEFGTKEKFIQYIQDNDLENELTDATVEEWERIEESAKVKRKPKYR
jgi:RecA/RadA recombinase